MPKFGVERSPELAGLQGRQTKRRKVSVVVVLKVGFAGLVKFLQKPASDPRIGKRMPSI
jgi:hypothetical protein